MYGMPGAFTRGNRAMYIHHQASSSERDRRGACPFGIACLLLLGSKGLEGCIALNGLSRLATRCGLRAVYHEVSALVCGLRSSRATRAYLILLSRLDAQGELRSCVES